MPSLSASAQTPTLNLSAVTVTLNGNNSLRIGSYLDLNPGSNDFTVAFRFTPTTASQTASLLDKTDSSNGYRITLSSGQEIGDIRSSSVDYTTGGNSTAASMSYHLAITGSNSPSPTLLLFENGTQVNSTLLSSYNITNMSDLVFGADQSGTSNFNGTISDIVIFNNQALTGSQLLAISGGSTTFSSDMSVGTLIGGDATISINSGAVLRVGSQNTSSSGSGNSFSGNMTGAGRFVKEGTGRYDFGGTYTATGSFSVANGTVKLTSAGVFPAAGSTPVVVDSLGTLDLNSTNQSVGSLTGGGKVLLGTGNLTVGTSGLSSSFPGVISGSGRLIKAGDGSFTLTGANTYSGGTTISRGTLVVDTTSLPGNPSNVANDGKLEFAQHTDGTYSGIISGTGALVKSGAGKLTLGAVNTYTGGTTVSAGTLAGTTQTLPGNIVDNATVEFAQSTAGTFSGIVSGTGALVKSGSGTLTLTGANSYSGGTTVSAGTLVGSTASLQGNIVDNATVEFAQSTAGTFSGAVSGTGALMKSGSGTLTLTGANSYSGGTTVSAGTLVGSTASLPGNIANSGTVEFAQSTDGTYTGAISGSGGLVKSGAGMLTLTGANSYSGGTTVSAGTLVGNLSSLTGNVTNNATLVVDQATDGTTSGVVSGTGSVVKRGAGTLTLGANLTQGSASVEAGGVNVASGVTLTAGTVSVMSGGTLSGRGIVAAALTNAGGTIRPGNSPGTLFVQGNYLQTSGVLELEVAGRNAGEYDQLNVTGTATLTGGSVRVVFQNFTPNANESFPLISATGGTTVASGVSVTVEGLPSNLSGGATFANGTFTTAQAAAAPVLTPTQQEEQTVEDTTQVQTRTAVTVVTAVIGSRIRNLLLGGGGRGFVQPAGGAITPLPGGGGVPGGGAPAGGGPGGGPGGPPGGGQQQPDSGSSGGDEADGSAAVAGIWMDGDYSVLKDSFPGAGFEATTVTTIGGLDVLVGERLVLGAGFTLDSSRIDTRDQVGGRDGKGAGGLMYAAYVVDETFTVALQGSLGEARTHTVDESSGTKLSGDYRSYRRSMGAQVLATVPFQDKFLLVGTAGYTRAKEAIHPYQLSSGEMASPEASKVGLIAVGAELGYSFDNGANPYVGANYSYDHYASNTDDSTGRGRDPSGVELSAGLRLQLAAGLSGGVSVRTEVDRAKQESYAAGVNLRYSF